MKCLRGVFVAAQFAASFRAQEVINFYYVSQRLVIITSSPRRDAVFRVREYEPIWSCRIIVFFFCIEKIVRSSKMTGAISFYVYTAVTLCSPILFLTFKRWVSSVIGMASLLSHPGSIQYRSGPCIQFVSYPLCDRPISMYLIRYRGVVLWHSLSVLCRSVWKRTMGFRTVCILYFRWGAGSLWRGEVDRRGYKFSKTRSSEISTVEISKNFDKISFAESLIFASQRTRENRTSWFQSEK